MNNIKLIITALVMVLIFSNPMYGNTWQQCKPLLEAMSPAVVAVNGIIYAVGSGTGPCATFIYDPANDTWVKKGAMNTIRYGFNLVETNGRIFAIGGMTQNNVATSAVEEYDISSGSWGMKNSMPLPRSDMGIAIVQNKIFVIGGFRADSVGKSISVSACNDVMVYDPQNDTWKTKAKMLKQRRWPAIVSLNGNIYAISGFIGDNDNYSTVGGIEEYDVMKDTWTEKAKYTLGLSLCQAVAINGKIYSIFSEGTGSQTDTHINEYDPELDTWTVKIHIPPIGDFAKLAINNQVYMFGGHLNAGECRSNKALKYDPSTNSLTSLPNLSEPKWGMGAAEIDGKIFIMGGSDWIGNNETYFNRVEAYDTKKDVGILNKNKLKDFSLLQNYPNPFNPDTIIRYQLSNSTHVELKIFDLLGREIITLVDKEQTAGKHEAKFDCNQLNSGIYFARLTANDFTETKKMVFQK